MSTLLESMKYKSRKAAEKIGVSMQELKHLRKKRAIPYYAIGHRTVVYDAKDLEAFLMSRRVPAAGGAI